MQAVLWTENCNFCHNPCRLLVRINKLSTDEHERDSCLLSTRFITIYYPNDNSHFSAWWTHSPFSLLHSLSFWSLNVVLFIAKNFLSQIGHRICDVIGTVMLCIPVESRCCINAAAAVAAMRHFCSVIPKSSRANVKFISTIQEKSGCLTHVHDVSNVLYHQHNHSNTKLFNRNFSFLFFSCMWYCGKGRKISLLSQKPIQDMEVVRKHIFYVLVSMVDRWILSIIIVWTLTKTGFLNSIHLLHPHPPYTVS